MNIFTQINVDYNDKKNIYRNIPSDILLEFDVSQKERIFALRIEIRPLI